MSVSRAIEAVSKQPSGQSRHTIPFHIVYGSLWATTAELSSFNKDLMACETKIFTIQHLAENIY